MHNTHLPLYKWFLAISMIADAKKGISSRQLARHLDIKAYKKTIAYNQLTRTNLKNFCNHFNLSCLDLLQDLFIKKAKLYKFKTNTR